MVLNFIKKGNLQKWLRTTALHGQLDNFAYIQREKKVYVETMSLSSTIIKILKEGGSSIELMFNHLENSHSQIWVRNAENLEPLHLNRSYSIMHVIYRYQFHKSWPDISPARLPC